MNRRLLISLLLLAVLPMPEASALSPRWTPLRYHAEQTRLRLSPARFKVVPCGRRSGKTEHFMRELVEEALECQFANGRYIAAAPTHPQAKSIFWDHVKQLVPKSFVVGRPNETDLRIRLINGAKIEVSGLDRPERIEGSPIDFIGIDEYANCKPTVWDQHVRPALATTGRPGKAWLFGVTRGGKLGHFAKLVDMVRALRAVEGDRCEWDVFRWFSRDIVDPAEVASAMATMDPVLFRQEFEAEFVSFVGRAYYPFDWAVHATERVLYDPACDLYFCFDFNVEPGVACVFQVMPYKGVRVDVDPTGFIGVIGEVWIPHDSRTEHVCNRLIADWKHHQRRVRICGDATGGARHTSQSQSQGSDWDQIREMIGQAFPGRMIDCVPNRNPSERARVNGVNGRLRSADGKVHIQVDPINARHVAEDLDNVALLQGGSGELHKPKDSERTHMTDGLGYGVLEVFPPAGNEVTVSYVDDD